MLQGLLQRGSKLAKLFRCSDVFDKLFPERKPETLEEHIRKLAHALWVKRGSPLDGHPEQDWFEAENDIKVGMLCQFGKHLQSLPPKERQKEFDRVFKFGAK